MANGAAVSGRKSFGSSKRPESGRQQWNKRCKLKLNNSLELQSTMLSAATRKRSV